MPNSIVIFDACVLYPTTLRDYLMFLSDTDLFLARWTARIQDEWINNLLEDRPDLSRERLERTRQKMEEHVDDCLVEGYEHLIDTLKLPDMKDRHVLAAAIHTDASFIITFNLRDFPASILDPLAIRAITPDNFAMRLEASNPNEVIHAAKRQRMNMNKPPKSVNEYLNSLEKQQLPKTVAFLRQHQEDI